MKYIDEKFEYEEFPPNSGTELVSQETYFAAAAEYVLNNPGLPGFKTADERFQEGDDYGAKLAVGSVLFERSKELPKTRHDAFMAENAAGFARLEKLNESHALTGRRPGAKEDGVATPIGRDRD